MANLFPKQMTDVYFAAFRIPDFVYALVITGGITAAFLPVFSERFRKNWDEAKNLTRSVLTFFLLALVLISFVLFIFSPQLIKIIAPGFSGEQKNLAVLLTRIMFLSPIFLGMSAVLTSILQFFNIFLATALAPIFYNLGIIAGILFFTPKFGLKGLAFGVILGAFLHFLIQVPPFLKSGFSFKPSFNFRVSGLRKIFVLMLPRIIGSAASHLNLIIVTAIASTRPSGAISVFNFANNIQSAPVSLIGISFATAIFPFLSRTFFENNKEKFLKNFSAIFSHILFLIIPLSLLIFLLRAQIVRLILGTSFFNGGFFGWSQTRLTAACLGIFSLSLFAASLIPFLAKVFFSRHNTKMPVKIALATMVLNIGLCYFFVWLLSFPNFFQEITINFLKLKGIADISVVGLPLAFSISTIFQFFLLNFFLKREIKALNFQEVCFCFKKILISTLLMMIFVYLSLNVYSLFFSTNTVVGIFFQTALAGLVAFASYLGFCHLLRIREAKSILSLLKKVKFIENDSRQT